MIERNWWVVISCFSPVSTKAKVRDAHRRIMVLNHPDKGELDFRSSECRTCFSLKTSASQTNWDLRLCLGLCRRVTVSRREDQRGQRLPGQGDAAVTCSFRFPSSPDWAHCSAPGPPVRPSDIAVKYIKILWSFPSSSGNLNVST